MENNRQIVTFNEYCYLYFIMIIGTYLRAKSLEMKAGCMVTED
jgi:hypothetical protein